MATLSNFYPTLADLAKTLDPNGKPARIIEAMSQTNRILDDMPWMEGNMKTGHQVTVQTSLPTASWRKVNAGTTPSKDTTAQFTEACGLVDSWSQVDRKVVELSKNAGEYRMQRARPHMQALGIEMAQSAFYANQAINPEEITGLAARFNSTSAVNGQNVLLGGGAGGDNTSIWLVGWGENTAFGIYPEGTQGGIVHTDHGVQVIQNAGGVSGALMEAYMDHFEWNCGIAVADWRYIVRIANIDVSALVAESGDADLIKLMQAAIDTVEDLSVVRPAFYANRTAMHWLNRQQYKAVKAGGGLTYENVAGRRTAMFQGIPVHRCDALSNAETLIS